MNGRTFQGGSTAAGRSFAIVASTFNEGIVRNLVDGARQTLEAADARVDLAWCPGAVELPLVAQKLAQSGLYDGIVALGCVVRGGTPHFEYVCRVAADGVLRVMLDTGIPVAFGVLTADDMQQAIDRSAPVDGGAGGKATAEKVKELGTMPDGNQNKGIEAAEAAIEMVGLLGSIALGSG